MLVLVVACVALVLGLFLGKKLAARSSNKMLQWVAIGALLWLIVAGAQTSSWVITALVAVGLSFVAAKFIGLAALCAVSGIVFAFAFGKTSKPE
jgi:uncharacterized membrane protein YfbV (UPF0208 family)